MKKYIKPEIESTDLRNEPLFLLSTVDDRNKCDSTCDMWHICRDRQYGKFCADKD